MRPRDSRRPGPSSEGDRVGVSGQRDTTTVDQLSAAGHGTAPRRALHVHGVAVLPPPTRPAETQPDPRPYSAGLARRRDAALRCEPLPGMPAVPELRSYDPLVAGLPGGGPAVLADILVIELVSEHTAALLGVPNQRARAITEALGLEAQFDSQRRCYLVRAQDVDRIKVVLEARGDTVYVAPVGAGGIR